MSVQVELTNKMEQKVTVVRDGHAEIVLSRLLVPGDVVLLVGGTLVPADVDWIEGDVLLLDTSAITGEALPRKVPVQGNGKRILAGITVLAGEAYCIVRKTGSHTEIGSSQEDIMHDKASMRKSVFEERVLQIVRVVILIAIGIVITILLVQGLVRGGFNSSSEARTLIATIVSILVASVPVALPLVLQVTMALGAGTMARDYNAVVTSLSALQDISSMTVLCSDKTGTLTTAHISIHSESIWCPDNTGFTQRDAVFYARLASNPDKEDDPVDRCCLDHFKRCASEEMKVDAKKFTLVRSAGFNPVYKRVIFVYSHPQHGVVMVAKGLPNKVVDTADGGKDDAEDQWKVDGSDILLFEVGQISESLSTRGYKTIGVAVRFGLQPWRFVGIIPLLDPPRHDSAQTIQLLHDAGISVKMITGDHENIAKEIARILGMSTNIIRGDQLRPSSENGDSSIAKIHQLVWNADGFAQVLPRDKRFVVETLRHSFNSIVGMTGDGVNDAPALSAAQCGIAVDNATDAAKNAAAILLTTPGLSPIYCAVVESRKIFRKLRAYVVYRIAATVQIVLSLTLLIFISNCPVNSIFVILLALFNDLTMLPVAYDQQKPSSTPDTLSIKNMLILSITLGLCQTSFTMLWAYVSYRIPALFEGNLNVMTCSLRARAAIWVQLTLSTELLIFSTRAATLIWISYPPSSSLLLSVILGSVIISVLAGTVPTFGLLYATDILLIWVYSLLALAIIDAIKCVTLRILGETFVELRESSLPTRSLGTTKVKDIPQQEETKDAGAMGILPTVAAPTQVKEESNNAPTRIPLTQQASPNFRSASDEAIAFDIELGRLSSSRSLLSFEGNRPWQAHSEEEEEKFQDMHIRRRQNDSQLRRVESWIKSPGTVTGRGESLSQQRRWGEQRINYQTAVSEALKGSAPRSLSGGDLVVDSRRTRGEMSNVATIEATRMNSAPASLRTRYAPPTREERSAFVPMGVIREGKIVLPSNYAQYGSWSELRRSNITASSLRPHTPASRSTTMTDRARESLLARLRTRSTSMG